MNDEVLEKSVGKEVFFLMTDEKLADASDSENLD
jgi:hypothetical protein